MLALLVFLLVLSLLYVQIFKRPKNFPPGPPLLSLFSNLMNLNFNQPNETIKRLNDEYGDCGLVAYQYKLVFLKSGELIKEMFNNDIFTERPDVNMNRDRFNGKNLGMICIGGELFSVNKRFALHKLRNMGMGRSTQEEVGLLEGEDLVQVIRDYQGEPFDIEPLLGHANLNITWAIIGGKRFNKRDKKFLIFADAVNQVVNQLSIFGNWSVVFPPIRHMFPKASGHEYYLRDCKMILSIIKEEIQSHKNTREPNNPRDFIDRYLDEIEKGTDPEYMSEEQLEAIVFDILVAGSGTPATVITIAIIFLAMNPDVQEKLYQEVSSFPTFSTSNNMPYCKAVFNEAMRIRPAVPIAMAHEATQDTKLGSYDIPKGTLLFAHLEEYFMDEKVWKDPEVFRPERFIGEDGQCQTPDKFLPFGKGKRKCLGEVQGRLSGTLFLECLIRNFEFALPKGVVNPNTYGKKHFVLEAPHVQIVARQRC